MKTKKIELDVDFIGGLGPLTKEEEEAISNFLKSRKSKRRKPILRKRSSNSRKRVVA